MAKILVIEDEVGVRDSIIDILHAEDFVVDSAANGKDGLRQIEEFHPDLVICDIMMPVLDGYGVIEQVRHSPEHATLPFVFLTAKGEKVDIRSGMTLGADDYLTKPFTHNDLLDMIHARLGARQAQDQVTQQQLDALRDSISTALPRELSLPMKEMLQVSDTLATTAPQLPPEEVAAMAKALHQNAQQLARLTHNLMLFVKLEHLPNQRATATALRQQVTDNAAPIIEAIAQAIAADYRRDQDLELMVEARQVPMSEAKLRKVCEELIDNAFKFSADGTPVKVFCPQRDDSFILHVIDYGQGMTPEQLAHLGPYLQFSPEADNACGLGLGLSIAKRLVELHQGEIMMESMPGQQTIVRVSIPLGA